MEVAGQRCERCVVGKPLKQFGKIGHPERPLKTSLDLTQPLRKRQMFSCFPGDCRLCPQRFCNSQLDGTSANAGHSYYFVSAACAGGYGNGGTRYFQRFREEPDAGFVCASIDGRRREFDLQSVTHYSGDAFPLRPRMNFHGEDDAVPLLDYFEQSPSTPFAEDRCAHSNTA